MRLRGGTVRAYLAALRDAATVPGATEHTLRPPLVVFLHAAARDLELPPISVHPELRLREVGQPDLQVVDGLGSPIGYGETKPIGPATAFARVLESELRLEPLLDEQLARVLASPLDFGPAG